MLLMWTDHLSVGIKKFDDDHKRLVRMINELHLALQDRDEQGNITPEEIEIALHRLQNYTQYHCLQEEKDLEETGFPDLEEHRAAHRWFFAQVAEMTERFRDSRNAEHARELMNFMYDWLTNHIHVVDMQYTSHLHKKGVF